MARQIEPGRDIVLVGGGHSHLGVLLDFARRPLPGVRLSLICSDPATAYTGMLPGYVAGHYRYDEVFIDLQRLAEFAGASFLRDEAIGIDRATRRVFCRQLPPVPYDVLSINVGGAPQLARVPGAAQYAAPVKPVARFNERWLALLARAREAPPLVVATVGAGAGGVELTLAMHYRLRRERAAAGRDPEALAFHLFAAGETVLPSHNPAVRANFEALLAARGITVHHQAEVVRAEAGRLTTRRGEALAVDALFWATPAVGAPWLAATGLSLDADGCILVGDSLQSEADPLVFASGDCAALRSRPLAKAGVFAVRMGKPLAENLRRIVSGQPLVAFRPQRHHLALISTGDKHAVASRGAFHWRGDWVWRWKDWIDRRFVQRFSARAPADRKPGRLDWLE